MTDLIMMIMFVVIYLYAIERNAKTICNKKLKKQVVKKSWLNACGMAQSIPNRYTYIHIHAHAFYANIWTSKPMIIGLVNKFGF